jgi:hypothetical protein
MRTVSRKRARQLAAYTKLRIDFLLAHPWCEFPLGCDRPVAVIHHRRGRFGGRLNDTAWWAASCIEHNNFAEDHTGEALELGWLVRIEGMPS